MTYTLTDRFSDFEYHDASICLISLENGTLNLSAEHLNVHRDALRESLPYDMEIEKATISLHAFTLHTLQKEAYACGADVDGNPILHNAVDYTGEKMHTLFLSLLRDGAHISGFTKEDDRYALELITASDVWLVHLSFSAFTVEWDAFSGMAWYESSPHPQQN